MATTRQPAPGRPTTRRDGLRARNRAALEHEILEVGRAHLARDGAAALSLRAIARELGMVSSALYRYVANRDELLTLLIVAAFTSLGNAVDTAHDQVDPSDLSGRWRAVGRAIRAWALTHPHEYALIYGSPVPDYTAPAERTSEPGTRVFVLLVRLFTEAAAKGRLARDAPTRPVTAGLTPLAQSASEAMLADPFFAEAGALVDADVLMSALAAWSLMMGAISAEIFGQLGSDTIADPDAYFDYMLEVARRLVLRD